MENVMRYTKNAYGECWWSNDDQPHREDGPAYIGVNGDKEWWINGNIHREDGPAVIFSNGQSGYYVNGCDVTRLVDEWAKTCDIDLDNLTEPDHLLLTMFLNGLSESY